MTDQIENLDFAVAFLVLFPDKKLVIYIHRFASKFLQSARSCGVLLRHIDDFSRTEDKVAFDGD